MWDLLLTGARFLQFAGALVLLGCCLFQLYGMPEPASPGLPAARWPKQVLFSSACIAMGGTVLWVMAETVLFSGNAADGTNLAAVWLVFSETRFGRACLWRIGLLLVVLAIACARLPTRPHWVLQSTLAGVIVATFAWTGHGAATRGWPGMLHLASDILHLWAAGIWVGALAALAILIVTAGGSRSPHHLHALSGTLRRFAGIGTAAVATLALSGLVNTCFMVGSADPLASAATAYGTVLLIKLGLFLLMLALAAANRFWLAPRMHVRGLRISIGLELGLGLLVLLAVSVLGTLPPPAAS